MSTPSSQRSANAAGHTPRPTSHGRPGHPVAATNPARVPPFDLLESKLRRPRVRDGAVPRGALIRLIEERSASMPIVFLSAGPGWGKTTLLAEWASGSRRPFAWVSLDENDNDPIVLLTYIAIAIDRITPLDSAVFDALASPGVSVEGTVVPRLGAALAAIQPAVVLALDDLHVLDDSQGLDAIATLSRHIPRSRSWCCPPGAIPRSRWQRCGRVGWLSRSARTTCGMDAGEAHRLLSAAGLTFAMTRSLGSSAHGGSSLRACTSLRWRSGPGA